jgi:hypothetical protein
METTPLRVEEILDGTSNFLSWKERVTLALKEYDLWELVEKVIDPPIDPAYLQFTKRRRSNSSDYSWIQ